MRRRYSRKHERHETPYQEAAESPAYERMERGKGWEPKDHWAHYFGEPTPVFWHMNRRRKR